METSIEFDDNILQSALQVLKGNFANEIPKALFELGGAILQKSGEEVPFQIGILQNSGTVVPISDTEVQVGYHTPYAARLHEHPEYNFANGRKGKYLIDPILKNWAAWQTVLYNRFKKLIS